MAINFPSDRSELGYAPGPLQPGDVWVNNRIQYIWFTSPDGTGVWSAKGVNINPLNYVNKAEQFPDQIDGSYNTGFTLGNATYATNAGTASTANQVVNPLRLNFTDAGGNTTRVIYDGSSPQEISFSDTDIASQELNVTEGFGIKIEDTNEIRVDANTVQAWSIGAAPGTSDNYVAQYNSTGDYWEKLRAFEADNAGYLGNLPASAYATRSYVDSQITTGGTNVNLDSVLLNQANQPVFGSHAEIRLENTGSYINIDTNGSIQDGQVLPARFDISQLQQNPDGSTVGSRSLLTSKGQLILANTVDPYIILRGRRTNNNFGLASISLAVPPNVTGFDQEPKVGDGILNITAEKIKIRTVEHPDGFFLGADNSGGGGDPPAPISGRVPDDIRNFYEETDNLDYAPALKRAITANGACYIPRGSFYCDSTVTITSTSAHIYGDGSGQSLLSFPSEQGLNFTGLRQGADWDTVTIKGITVSGPGNGTGINITYGGSGNSAQKVYCEDVAVQNFATGWNLTDTDNSTYNACSALNCTTGISCQSGFGDAVNIRFNNWQIADCTTGVNIDTRSEGVYVTDSVIIGCITGVYFKGNTTNINDDSAEPYFVLRGNNIDCVSNSVIMEACIQASITDNSFYKRNDTAGDWVGLRVFGNSYDNVFSNNIFNGMTRRSGPSKTGVSIERLAHSTFSNNHFLELNAAYNIAWIPEVNGCSFVDNDYRELDVVIPTPTNGNSLNVNVINQNHLIKEKGLDRSYHILNGDGVIVYDALNADGFRLTPDNVSGGGSKPDVETYGADIHWDDLTGGNDADKFGDFVSRVNSGAANSLFVPGGKTIRLTQQYTFTNKAGFVGPPAALGKNLPGIVFAHNSTVGLNCTEGIRARNFKFDGTGKKEEFESTQPTTLIRVGTFNGSNNQDDIDSSFRYCEFGNKRSGNILQFNGRNVNVGNCAFSNCKGCATLLKLQWDDIEEDESNDGDAFYTTSWRKNRIYNNQFHVHDSCTAIDVDGKQPIGGLAVTDNMSDTGCNLLLMRGAGANGCTVSGNVWYGRNKNEAGVIRLSEGTIHGMCITGNSFSGFHTNVSNETGDVTDRPANFIKVTSQVTVFGLAITGNTFSYCTARAIDIAGDQAKQKTTITGNVFYGTANPPYPTNAAVHVGNVY